MGKYEDLAKNIIDAVGGTDNIVSLTHCVTRLRFILKDESKADDNRIKNMKGVITLKKSGGQYQVVIGNHVPDVYADVCRVGGISDQKAEVKSEKKKNVGNVLIDMVSGIFLPALALLCACGMIKGFNSLFSVMGLYTEASTAYLMMNSIGDSLFYFFPVILGYTTAKKMNMNPFIGLVIGAALMYPDIQNVDISFFGHIVNVSYSSTVLPVILTTIFAVYVNRLMNKIIPDVIKSFVAPMFTLLISVPLGFVLIGPVANTIANGISSGLTGINDFSPILCGLLVGGLWQVLVIFGIHTPLIMACIMSLMAVGTDPIIPFISVPSFAQTAVVFAIWMKTKDKDLKQMSAPAWISGIFGVTEPAIYGITLPRIKFFVISCIGGAIGGLYYGIMGVKAYSMGSMGIFAIPSMINPDNIGYSILHALLGIAIAMVFSFVVTMILYKDNVVATETTGNDRKNVETKETAQLENKSGEITIVSPMKGDVVALNDVPDDVFASGAMGQGMAINPTEGKVFAPADGEITTFFPTGHAVGISTAEGTDILIHVGMDTVELKGKCFTPKAKQGDHVKKGQLLLEFDIAGIKEAGYSVVTPIIIANTDNYEEVKITASGTVNVGKEIMKLG